MKLSKRRGAFCLLALLLVYPAIRGASAPTSGGSPLSALVREAIDGAPIRGRVEQRLPAGGYTYHALRTADDALVWAVTLGSGAPVGAEVVVRSMGRSANFYSPRLQRRFDELVFATLRAPDLSLESAEAIIPRSTP